MRTRCLLLFALVTASTAPVLAQTISQDYARYAGMLNQERADTAARERQDYAASSARGGSSSGGSSGGGGSSSGSSGSSSNSAEIVGMLGNTLSSMADRHNARAAERQKRDNDARAAYEQRTRDLRIESDRVLAAMERAHPLIQRNLEKAAGGDLKALGDAGLQYVLGTGVQQNVPRGLTLLNDAASRGDSQSIKLLARYYSDGEPGVVKPDPALGHKWTLKLAEAGDVDRMANVCSNFISGKGTSVDFKAADHWCTLAMDKGDAVSANNLGVLYVGQYPGQPADLAKSKMYFTRAAALGSPQGKENLANLTAGLLGGEPDYAALFLLHQQGAAKNDPVSETDLGILYINGKGTPRNEVKAVEWLNKAIKDGSNRAIYELGQMYDFGVGVPVDKTRARKMYRQAAVQGWPSALFTMGIRTMNGSEDMQMDQIEGERLLHLAADKGDAEAPMPLGQIYLNGFGVEKDRQEAIRWFKLGAERGNKDCEGELKKLT